MALHVRLLSRLGPLAILLIAGGPAAQVTLEETVVGLLTAAREASAADQVNLAVDRYRQAAEALTDAGLGATANAAFVENELSVALRVAGRPREALEAARRAVAIVEDQASGQVSSVYKLNLAQAAVEVQEYDTALTVLASAIENARDATALHTLALSLRERGLVRQVLGDYDGALSDWRAAADAGEAAGLANEARLALLRLEARVHLIRHDIATARDTLDAIRQAEFESSGQSPDALAESDLLEARVLMNEGDFTAAAETFAEVIVAEQLSPLVRASAHYNLAEIEFGRGNFARSDIENRRAEALYSAELPSGHYALTQTAHRRAVLLQEVGDLEAAAEVYARVLADIEAIFDTTHPSWISTAIERSQTLARLGQRDEAIGSLARVLDGGVEGRGRLLAQSALGLILSDAGMDAEAEPYLVAAVEEWTTGKYGLADAPPTMIALSELRLRQRRPDDAVELSTAAADLLEALGARSIDRLLEARRVSAEALIALSDEAGALAIARGNLQDAYRQVRSDSLSQGVGATYTPPLLRRQISQAMDLLWAEHGDGDPAVLEELFRAAQLLQMNETSSAATRTYSVVRRRNQAALAERDELVERIRALEAQLVAEYRRSSVGVGSADRLRAEIARLEAALSELDERLRVTEPRLFDYLSPPLPGIAAVQAALRPNQALYVQSTFETHTYLFLLTPGTAEVTRVQFGAAELAEDVAALRRTLDLKGQAQLPVFDAETAQRLYDRLFGPFAERILATVQLYIVADLAAQQMSPATLVIGSHDGGPVVNGGDSRSLRFLGHEVAFAVLPAAEMLTSAQNSGVSRDTGSVVGFGDPDLEGGAPAGTRSLSDVVDQMTGLADPLLLRSMFEPLPEARLELDAIRTLAGSRPTEVYLGADASELMVKSVDLSKAGTLIFATHAVVGGDFAFLEEPALVMSPPDHPSSDDDGLLFASEISGLNIGARLVILSACNTGSSSGRSGAPGLSGLARAFWLAGAESMLVSHWSISSIAPVLITPAVYAKLADEPGTHPSQALQRAMRDFAARPGNPIFAHPAMWGSFSVVGVR